MNILFANRQSTTLAQPMSSTVTSLTVQSGTGAGFPQPTGSQFFVLTLNDTATQQIVEILHVTAVAGDVMTVVRAQENTTARAWLAGDIAANWLTAGTLTELYNELNLGFTPVQQGGGTDQTNDKVYIGESTAVPGRLRAQIDTTDLAEIAQYSDVLSAILNRQPFPGRYYSESSVIEFPEGWYGFEFGAGGGGGGGCTEEYSGSGGGASGDVIIGQFYVPAPTSIQFVAGNPGLGGYSGDNLADNGTPGGNSTFLGMVAQGGGGGNSADAGTYSGAGGTFAGTSTIPNPVPQGVENLNALIHPGSYGGDGTGQQGVINGGKVCLAGNGAASRFCGGGRGGNQGGLAARGFGAGGGGAYNSNNSGAGPFPGGNGGGGYLFIWTLMGVSPGGS